MTKNRLFKAIVISTALVFLFQNVSFAVFPQKTFLTADPFTLASYSTFQSDVSESPGSFTGTLDLNKHFVFAAVSIAEYLLVKGGKTESLPKWVERELPGDFKKWALKIMEARDMEVHADSLVFSVASGAKIYRARIHLKKQDDGSTEGFGIDVNEVRDTAMPVEKDRPEIVPATAVWEKDEIVKVGFSVLSSDLDRVADEAQMAVESGVDFIHIDHIDGKLTPGLPEFDSSGQIRQLSGMSIPFAVHLMTEEPSEAFVSRLIDCGLREGRDTIAVHFEAFKNASDLYGMVKFIHGKGFKTCLVVNPETQVNVIKQPLRELRDDLDSVMLMLIIPGAGSRPLIEGTSGKIGELRRLLVELELSQKVSIVADGGLNAYSVKEIVSSGVDMVITRSWLLGHSEGIKGAVAAIKDLSRHRNESTRLMDMLGGWGLADYRYVIGMVAMFSKGDDTFTEEEVIKAIKRFPGVKHIRVNDDRVVDVYYGDKLVRFHADDIIPIEHLGLQDRTSYDGITVKIYKGNVTNGTKGEYILGISGSWHDSSAVLVKDGRIVAALEEERMTRVKHDSSLFPVNAIKKLLADNNIGWDDIKHIAFGWNFNLYVDTPHSVNPNEVFFREMDEDYARSRGISPEEVIRRGSAERNKERFDVAKVQDFLREMSGYYDTGHEPKVSFVGHNRSHAASAYYTCGFDGKVLTVALDGYGDFETGSVWLSEDGKMKEISRFRLPHSMGWMWAAITEYLGFKPTSDEGQIMGFAPYGEPWDAKEMARVMALRKIFEDYIKFDPKSETLVVDPENYYYGEIVDGKNRVTRSFQEKLAALGIKPYEGNSKTIDFENSEDRPYANLAYVLQERTEQVMLDMVRHYFKDNPKTKGTRKLALGGGIALNILANGKLISNGLVYGHDLFVQPAAGDSGTAIGASLTVAREIYGQDVNHEMERADYGPSYTDEKIEKVLKEFGLVEGDDYSKCTEEELISRAAGKIEAAYPIAWFQGASEFGPRALGSRSVLLNLSDVQANNTANVVKGRQPWRPSASSVLEEQARDYFMGIGKSPFMVVAFPILHRKKSVVLSGTHQFGDKLARPQTVSPSSADPRYYALLKKLEEMGTTPAVVNTSFNKQEPLVEHPEEALDTFYYMDKVQDLFIGSFAVRKGRNLKPRIVSLQDEAALRDTVKKASETGDINLWMSVFDTIEGTLNPNCHKVEILMDCGKYGMKQIRIPLVKDLFSGTVREPVLNFMASYINDCASEFGARKIYIGCTFKKMDGVVYQTLKEKLSGAFPRMRFFANFGEKVDILPLPAEEELAAAMSLTEGGTYRVESLSGNEKTGRYIGVDVGASRIKCVLVENGAVTKQAEERTTFEGGRELGAKIRRMIYSVSGNKKIDGAGIALAGVVDSLRNKVAWLINYELEWAKESGVESIGAEYDALTAQLKLLEDECGDDNVKFLNDGTAFGISSLNAAGVDNAVVVALGTGIGAARIERGAVDVSRIEQSGAFVMDVSEKAVLDPGCEVRGCFAAGIRDSAGRVISAKEMAEKMVPWFVFMNRLKGDRNFIITGGVVEGAYGRELMGEISGILGREEFIKYRFKISLSSVDETYGGAIGAAQFAMGKSRMGARDTMDRVHMINMSMLDASRSDASAHYIITEDLVPVPLRGRFSAFLSELYRKYPFLKEREEIRMVRRDQIESTIGILLSGEGSDHTVTVALSSREDIARLPEGVKALVFSGVKEDSDFAPLEGVLAALRAIERGNAANLVRLFELLTGNSFDLSVINEEGLSRAMSDPEALAGILTFNLTPMTELTGQAVLTNAMFQHLEESA